MTSRASSSKPPARFARELALAALIALAGCTNGQSNANSDASASPPPPNGKVGYVRMDDLVKVHPLYPELTRLDDDMAALQFKSLGPGVPQSGADLSQEEASLQRELDGAAARTKKQLEDLQKDYAGRERAAIAAALGATGGSAQGGGDIDAGINAQLQAQARKAAGDAQKNFNAYRDQLVKQDQTAFVALQQSLNDRARRAYEAKVAEYQRNETDYAYQLAQDDSADRLSLREKLTNLALDDAARDDIKTQLAAIDQKEGDQVAAMRNRDQAQLVALQKTLHDQSQAELEKQVAAMRARTIAKITEREQSTRTELLEKLHGTLPGGAQQTQTAVAGGIPPDMRARLAALHQKYQDDFTKDANKTIADFQKFKSDIQQRFDQLHGIDGAAQNEAQKQIGALQRQRGELYEQMVAQIGREVKSLAERRGINTVISDVVAPANGVDLTSDAEKDIESLHE